MTPSLTESVRVVASREQMSTMIGGEAVILGTRDAAYYGLDGAGAFTWELVQEPRTIGEIADAVCATFAVERPVAVRDVLALADTLIERGLLVVVDPPAR